MIPEDMGNIMRAREIVMKRVRDAAAAGDSLAGSLLDLEITAAPFFLGTDEDPDDSDLGVWP